MGEMGRMSEKAQMSSWKLKPWGRGSGVVTTGHAVVCVEVAEGVGLRRSHHKKQHFVTVCGGGC